VKTTTKFVTKTRCHQQVAHGCAFSARQDDSVEVIKFGDIFHQARLKTEVGETTNVSVKRSLERQYTD
jgi:hypothetical protein